jgi:hypothetical protein
MGANSLRIADSGEAGQAFRFDASGEFGTRER